nr:RIIa domain-containing protein 1 isoform X2 [Oryctolagus cuniculus]
MATLPSGLLGPEPGLLSPEQLEKLRVFKIETRIANEKYLRAHKEVEFLISGFLRKIKNLYIPILGSLQSKLGVVPAEKLRMDVKSLN